MSDLCREGKSHRTRAPRLLREDESVPRVTARFLPNFCSSSQAHSDATSPKVPSPTTLLPGQGIFPIRLFSRPCQWSEPGLPVMTLPPLKGGGACAWNDNHTNTRLGYAKEVYIEFDFNAPKCIVILFPRELQGLKSHTCWCAELSRGEVPAFRPAAGGWGAGRWPEWQCRAIKHQTLSWHQKLIVTKYVSDCTMNSNSWVKFWIDKINVLLYYLIIQLMNVSYKHV